MGANSILSYADDISQAETDVRQKYTNASGNYTKSHDAGRALVMRKSTFRHRNPDDAKDDESVSSNSAADKGDQNSSIKNVGEKYHDMRNK